MLEQRSGTTDIENIICNTIVGADGNTYNLSSEKLMPKLLAHRDICSYLKKLNVEGDIVELGCGNGDNVISFALASDNFALANDKMIYGFDTFTGYQVRDLEDEEIVSDSLRENLTSDRWSYNKDDIEAKLNNYHFDKNTCLIEGDISETTKEFVPKSGKISLLYIDCNLYRPAINALNNLKKYFSNQCLVYTDSGFYEDDDEYLCGEHRALLEFHKQTGYNMYRSFYGNQCAFFIQVIK